VNAPPIRLGELAARLGLELEGDSSFTVRGVASLESAGPEDLVFVRSERFGKVLAESRAGAAIAPPGVDAGSRPVIRSPHPDLDFARAVSWIVPTERPEPGVHPTAVLASDARVAPTASLGPHVVIGSRCAIGARSVIHANAVLYPDVKIGEDCMLHAGVVLREGTKLGDRVILQPGVILGGDGFGYTFGEKEGWTKLPQVGRVVVENDVEIGANTTVDRGTLGETRIGRGAKLDNLIQIAHNCEIGERTVIAAQTGLAGSTIVGSRAVIMAQAASGGHLKIGEGAFVAARAGLRHDVLPGARVWGVPQMEGRKWHRTMSALGRLPEALRRLRTIEKKLGLRPSGDEPELR
jgi:UDP-3-O-[3-hydroxymyristoyl] glucosamine N-acyltransferase